MKPIKLLTFGVILIILSIIPQAVGHEDRSIDGINEFNEIEVDVSPQRRRTRYSTIPVIITQDSTTFHLGSNHFFSTQHILRGYLNFSNLDLDYDGFEAYEVLVHYDVYFPDFGIEIEEDPYTIGRTTRKISSNALHDGEVTFLYYLNNLDDIEWSPQYKVSSVKNFFEDSNNQDELDFRIEISLEFKRATKQNATFDMFYQLETYESPDVPSENFHYKQIMSTFSLPSSYNVDGTSAIGSTDSIYLFLPDELIPRYFKPGEGHDLNLTEIPLTIKLRLDLSNADNKNNRGFTIKHDGMPGSRTEKNDRSEEFRIVIDLKNTPLIPISITTIGYEGNVYITVSLEMTSLWGDRGLYAKNEYPLSPNQYILIMVFTGTVFVYKIVDYVDYRKYQIALGYKNYSLVEKEFIN